jgi:hypothetical protein
MKETKAMTPAEEAGDVPNDFFAGLHAYLKSPKFQEGLDEVGSAARQFAQMLVPLVQVVQAASTRFAAYAGTVDFERLALAFEAANRWAEEAPGKLKEALATGGVVPHPQISLLELRELTTVFEASGSRAAAAYLTKLHEELLTSESFRQEAQKRWQQVGRWQVFSEVLAAYDAQLYSVAIPPAIAQAEGIVAHLFGLKGMKVAEFKKRIAELHDDDMELFGPLAQEVVAGLLQPFEHGSPSGRLNRHAVMHGGDAQYGTKENAVAAIVWADYIMYTAHDYKAIAIPKTAAEAAAIMRGG